MSQYLIKKKNFLKRIYDEWYSCIAAALPNRDGNVLELGSGSGFLQEYIPNLMTSDVLPHEGVQYVIDGSHLPCADASMRGIVMTDVLHHISDVKAFLNEANRCLVPGGRVVMIEPWVTSWSKFIYKHFHHEGFDTETEAWEFKSDDPKSDANGALPWILFERDRKMFEQLYTDLHIKLIKPFMPFRYALSGGVSHPSFMPGWSYNSWVVIEKLLHPWMNRLAMFAQIELEKIIK